MATENAAADDIVYDLIAVQYHALKAAQTADKYLEDAHDHADIRSFFEEIAQQDAERARRCHEFLGQLTAKGGLTAS